MKETVGVVLFILILLCCVGSCDRGCAPYSAAPAPPRAAVTREVKR
jgi:hypothetical protein